MIKVTDKAAKKLKELRESENYSSDHNVRVKVKSGGCSGLQYDLNFDNIISDKDITPLDLCIETYKSFG